MTNIERIIVFLSLKTLYEPSTKRVLDFAENRAITGDDVHVLFIEFSGTSVPEIDMATLHMFVNAGLVSFPLVIRDGQIDTELSLSTRRDTSPSAAAGAESTSKKEIDPRSKITFREDRAWPSRRRLIIRSGGGTATSVETSIGTRTEDIEVTRTDGIINISDEGVDIDETLKMVDGHLPIIPEEPADVEDELDVAFKAGIGTFENPEKDLMKLPIKNMYPRRLKDSEYDEVVVDAETGLPKYYKDGNLVSELPEEALKGSSCIDDSFNEYFRFQAAADDAETDMLNRTRIVPPYDPAAEDMLIQEMPLY